MTKIKQSEAVYQAVVNVCGELPEGEAYNLPSNSEERKQVKSILAEGFTQGRIELKDTPSNAEKLADSAKLDNYCSGLTSNWLRKDPRLNGNVAYVAKNPGSRAGSNDTMVKAMRDLLKIKTDPADKADIQRHIDARLAVIKPTKTVTINVADLPAELQHLVTT